MSTPDPASPEPPLSNPPVPVVSSQTVGGDERQWAMLAHLSALIGYLLTAGWAGSAGGFLGPLIVWLVKKDTMPFVDQQGKEALNFSITISIAFAVLFGVGIPFGILTLGLGFLPLFAMMAVVGIYALVFTIVASIKAYEGVPYRYPITLRLIK